MTGHVVIIDEAHNLIDTILSIHSVVIGVNVIRHSLMQLTAYTMRFKTRLSGVNALHLKRLLVFLKALDSFCRDHMLACASGEAAKGHEGNLLGIAQFMSRLGTKVECINLLEIRQYMRASRIARKVSNYCDIEMRKTTTGMTVIHCVCPSNDKLR